MERAMSSIKKETRSMGYNPVIFIVTQSLMFKDIAMAIFKDQAPQFIDLFLIENGH